MGQASKEEDEEEEEEVTAREAGPDLISSPGKLTAINLINAQQQIPHGQHAATFPGTSKSLQVAPHSSRGGGSASPHSSILGCSLLVPNQQLCSRTLQLFSKMTDSAFTCVEGKRGCRIIKARGPFSYIIEGILKGCEPMSQNHRGLGAQNQSTGGDAEDKRGLT